MTRYPNSACEAHSNVQSSEPFCPVCMSNALTTAQRENQALRERLERAEKDAARYAWLRAGAWREAKPEPTGSVRLDVVLYPGDWPGDQSAMVDFDMAIDAALTPVADGAASGERG